MPRVLIVDDREDAAAAIQDVMPAGFDCEIKTTINGGLSALRQDRDIEDPRERYAIAILDMWFDNFTPVKPEDDPKKIGMRLVIEAANDPFLQIIIKTAVPDVPLSIGALEHGAFDFVTENSGRRHLNKLRKAVPEADKVRNMWLELDTDLKKMRNQLQNMEGWEASVLRKELQSAFRNFETLLKNRGHHLFPPQVDD